MNFFLFLKEPGWLPDRNQLEFWYGVCRFQFHSATRTRASVQSETSAICEWRRPYKLLDVRLLVGHDQLPTTLCVDSHSICFISAGRLHR